MTIKRVKRAFRYRFYPTDAQAAELSRTFVWTTPCEQRPRLEVRIRSVPG